ncbi:MAG: L,D-transpeptidase family protein [Rhizobiaceae bacterium]|nr:L,D-transpeptidase family protein [Rhizobiaceae bacterium]
MRKSVSPPAVLVRRSPLGASLGILQVGALRMRCALGRAATSVFKREGDGATPVATMAVLSAYARSGRLPGLKTGLAVAYTRQDSGWCDSPTHPAYNRPVRFPFSAGAETLQRDDRLYDFVVVLDWNVRSRGRHKGSAIFLHVAREGYRPTEGCVAVSPADMRRLAPLLRKGSRLTVLR